MIIIRKRTYARAGLLGNPSDGYHGKTISFIIRNLWAEVVLYEWDILEIIPTQDDRSRFRSVQDLAQDVVLHGYYGGIRLIKATIKRFVEYCQARGLALHERNFSIRYSTTIPRQVGLAGSSSIIVATLRCLMEFYDIEIPLEAQPMFVLTIESEELGITAGLQDRVIQCYEGMVYMDFDPGLAHLVAGITCYGYKPLDTSWLPPLYVAYHDAFSEPTEVFHNDLRGRYDRGEATVVNAMQHFAALAVEGRQAILNRDTEHLSHLIDDNFDTRRSIAKLPLWQIQMIETARQCGVSAKFAGSGGAIVGIYHDQVQFQTLTNRLAEVGAKVIVPQITG